jgi:hypothetical protein
MKKYAILLLLISLTATFANAQFPIRIPKIKIPKVEQTKPENTSQKPAETNQPASKVQVIPVTGKSKTDIKTGASPSDEVRILDSKTLFDLEEVRVSHQVVGWMMKTDFWLTGDIPNRSALRIFVKKSGKELISYRCEISDNRSFRCSDKTQVVKELGMLDVEVIFLNGSTDEKKPLKKYKIDVHRTERFNDYAHFFVNRHPDVAVAYLSIEGLNPWVLNQRTSPIGKDNKYQLTFNALISRDYLEKYTGDSFLRCSVNGQPFTLKRSNVNITDTRDTLVTYESKYLTGTRKGSVYKDYLKFGFLRIGLPLALGTDSTIVSDISNKPGNWECKITRSSDRELIRTFRFTLDTNGQIVTHPEQQKGKVVFAPWEYMIEMDIPPGGSPIDHRLKRSPELGFFHGIPWTTPEGRAMAERVPNKGNPFPLPAK